MENDTKETEKQKVLQEIVDYRRKHFDLTISPSRNATEFGEVTVSITKNGSQWDSFSLTPTERLKLIRALVHYG